MVKTRNLEQGDKVKIVKTEFEFMGSESNLPEGVNVGDECTVLGFAEDFLGMLVLEGSMGLRIGIETSNGVVFSLPVFEEETDTENSRAIDSILELV